MIVRIAEIQVDPANLDEYLERARTIGADSVANEPGVIAIFPMQDKRNPGQIRILEITRMKQRTTRICRRLIS